MGFFKNMVDWFSSSPVPSANTVEEAMAGAMPNYEPKEVPMVGDERKPAKSTKTKHTKTSLMKKTKSQLEALGRKEFNLELDKRKTKATLVKELLGTIKKAG
jgi:hypothetical protein